MDKHTLDNLPEFLEILGLDEVPMGVFYTDKEPADGFSPKSNDLPTREKEPELVSFFMRPESLSGLHQLAAFVTNNPEVVASPWGAACGNLVVWPLHYLSKGIDRAVLGGWDPSARKFFKTDELSFTVPWRMFQDMLHRYNTSFLKTETWSTVQKKIARSRERWE